MEMIQTLQKAWETPDLRKRILFVIGMLMLFRLIAHIPVPNINPDALADLQRALAENQLTQLLNIFSGGALQNFSVAAMGVYPYITATIIMQLLNPLIPYLEELSKEGEQGRQKLNRYQMYLTIPLCFLQAFGQTQLLTAGMGIGPGLFRSEFDLASNFLPSFTILMSMTAGSMLLVWMGEQINEYGIGNGISIIIFGGIVTGLPGLVIQGVQIGQTGDAETFLGLFLFLIIGLLTIVGIVLIQEGQRRIPVQYAKRVRGNKVYGGQASHIPLKVNMAGMIPLIFAQSIIIFPGVVASWFYLIPAEGQEETIGNKIAGFFYYTFNPMGAGGGVVYITLLFLLVVGFTYFYTMVLFSQQNIAENLQKNGGFIPGIRPGKSTEVYLNRVLTRITLVGALALGIVAILPFITQSITGIQIGIGGAALLIVVGVAVDTMRQLEAQLVMRDYRGFI